MGAVLQALSRVLAEGLASVLAGDPEPAVWPADAPDGPPEHPWAFHHIQALGQELTIVEVGGADPALRSTLVRAGHRVIAVGPCATQTTAASGAVVELRADALCGADIPEASVDVPVSIKALEHLSAAEADAVMEKSRRVLRSGGHVVVSLSGSRSDVRPVLDAFDAELLAGELVQPRGFLDSTVGPRVEGTAAFARCFVARKR